MNQEDMVELQLLETMQELKEVEQKREKVKVINQRDELAKAFQPNLTQNSL